MNADYVISAISFVGLFIFLLDYDPVEEYAIFWPLTPYPLRPAWRQPLSIVYTIFFVIFIFDLVMWMTLGTDTPYGVITGWRNVKLKLNWHKVGRLRDV